MIAFSFVSPELLTSFFAYLSSAYIPEPACGKRWLELILIYDSFLATGLYLRANCGAYFLEASDGSRLAFLVKDGSFIELSFF